MGDPIDLTPLIVTPLIADPIDCSLSHQRFDSLIEKCEIAIKDMHRPIFGKGTANKAIITANYPNFYQDVGKPLTKNTFDFIKSTILDNELEIISGEVSSYNRNTYKGRIFVPEEGRPIPFELSTAAKKTSSILLIVKSLTISVQSSTYDENGYIQCKVYRRTSKSGILKGFYIVDIVN